MKKQYIQPRAEKIAVATDGSVMAAASNNNEVAGYSTATSASENAECLSRGTFFEDEDE